MPDTVLKSVVIRNWTTVKESYLEFPDRGLILVRGVNLSAGGKMASIGSGKTSLGEAISRAMFGVRGRYTQIGHYSTRGQGNSYVLVDCLHKGKPLTIEMGFKCEELSMTGEGLKFTYDGQEVQRGHLDDTRADLSKILTVPTDLAGWTVHLDGDALKFADLSDAKAVELLMAALMQPKWSVCSKTTNEKVSDLKRQQAAATQALAAANSDVAEAEMEAQTAAACMDRAKTVYDRELKENKDKRKENAQALANFAVTLAQYEKKKETIKTEITRRSNLNAEKLKAAEEIVYEKQESKNALAEEFNRLHTIEATAKRDYEYAQRQWERAKTAGTACPTCGKEWDQAKAAILEHDTDMAAKQTIYAAAVKATKAKVQTTHAANEAWQAARANLQAIREKDSVDDLSLQYEDLEAAVRKDQLAITMLQEAKVRLEHGPDKSALTRFETQIKERAKNVAKTKAAVEKAAAQMAECEELLRVVGYWQEAFASTGIPNMILGDALGPLNAASRRVSTVLSGGSLSVSYATSKPLAKGGSKSELMVNVQNELGAHRAEGSSKGEGGLNNLIVAETLAEVGGIAHRIGYRWYDEVGANQDEIVRRSIYAYLADLAQRHGILIFMVSHFPEAANYANHTLIAEKNAQGVTDYRWA